MLNYKKIMSTCKKKKLLLDNQYVNEIFITTIDYKERSTISLAYMSLFLQNFKSLY